MNLYDDFKWRGLIYDITPGLDEVLAKEKVTGYIGFDPTASSLHVGSLLPLMALARLCRHGHKAIAIIGGGTGLIGDPSGKLNERPMLPLEQIMFHIEGMTAQVQSFLNTHVEQSDGSAIVIDNAEWLTSLKLVEFLRDIGKVFSVNTMIAKESIRRRLQDQEGISFTEFSYLLLQSYDFLRVFDDYDCTLQLGGSDQWGNITAGIDLIRRLRNGKAYGLVMPLVMSSSGTKFGKTESGTVWLDPNLTSPYKFYQYWINATDSDVITYLKHFTWLNEPEITELENELASAPEKRQAQKVLAQEVTRIMHGDDALRRAERITELLFQNKIEELRADEIYEMAGDAPVSELQSSVFEGDGTPLVDIVAQVGVSSSKSEARRLVKSGGLYVNNHRISEMEYLITRNDSIEGRVILLRKGKKEYHLIKII